MIDAFILKKDYGTQNVPDFSSYHVLNDAIILI